MSKPDGNDFQFRVKKLLTDNGWEVRMSPHYNDAFSEKPREIDIIAEKGFPPAPNSVYNSTVIVRLFIECKYIAERTTFWFDRRNLEAAKKVVNSLRSFHEVERNTLVSQKHHYLFVSNIAKLYRTDGKNNPDGDPIYKGITQCLNAYIYFRHHPTNLKKKYDHQTVVELDYPVMVFNSFDNCFKKDTTIENYESLPDELIKEPFQLEVDYAFTLKDRQSEELFYIDVINLDALSNFETTVFLEEINLAKQKVSDDQREAIWHRSYSDQNDDYDPFSSV